MSYIQPCIAMAADTKYLPHAKSLMVNCRRQGQWKGDFCLIMPPNAGRAEFEARGIHVLEDPEPTYYRKFALVDQFFERWNMMLYLDCDVLVQAPLEPLLHEVEWGTILVDREPFTLYHAFTHWANDQDLLRFATTEEWKWLWANHNPNTFQNNTGIMLWHPRTLPPNGRALLREMRLKIAPINTHVGGGTDQPIFNLVYYGLFRQVRSCLFSYWYSAWEQTIAIHMCSGYAPWIAKKPGMDAHFNEKLGRPYHDVYLENLADFNETFPKK